MSKGDLLTLVGALGFAAQIAATGFFAPRTKPAVLALTQIVAAAVLFIIVTPFVEHITWDFGWQAWAAIVWTALSGTVFGFMVQAWAQKSTTSTRAAVILGLEGLFAAAFGLALRPRRPELAVRRRRGADPRRRARHRDAAGPARRAEPGRRAAARGLKEPGGRTGRTMAALWRRAIPLLPLRGRAGPHEGGEATWTGTGKTDRHKTDRHDDPGPPRRGPDGPDVGSSPRSSADEPGPPPAPRAAVRIRARRSLWTSP